VRNFTTLIILFHLFNLYLNNNKEKSYYFKLFFLLILIFEIVIFNNKSITNRDVLTANEISNEKLFGNPVSSAVSYLNKIDSGLYRISKDFSSGPTIHQSYNDAMMYGYLGLGGYSSFHNANYLNFLQLNGALNEKDESDFKWSHKIFKNNILSSYVGAKYLITKKDYKSLNNYITKIWDKNGVYVFKNNIALPLFFTLDNWISVEDFSKFDQVQKNSSVYSYYVINKEDALKLNYENYDLEILKHKIDSIDFIKQSSIINLSEPLIISFKNNYIKLQLKTNKNNILISTIPDHKGWSVYVDGKKTEKVLANGGLIAVPINSQDKVVELKFFPPNLFLGIMLSLSSFIVFLFIFFRKKNYV
jgi:uncharacterized membrane protein YfhO